MFEPPRFQSVSQAVGQLLEIIDKREFGEDIPGEYLCQVASCIAERQWSQ